MFNKQVFMNTVVQDFGQKKVRPFFFWLGIGFTVFFISFIAYFALTASNNASQIALESYPVESQSFFALIYDKMVWLVSGLIETMAWLIKGIFWIFTDGISELLDLFFRSIFWLLFKMPWKVVCWAMLTFFDVDLPMLMFKSIYWTFWGVSIWILVIITPVTTVYCTCCG